MFLSVMLFAPSMDCGPTINKQSLNHISVKEQPMKYIYIYIYILVHLIDNCIVVNDGVLE